MSTANADPQVLIGDSFDAPNAYVYVYRNNGSSRPDGAYLKRYEQVIELEDLRRDVGPGMYILLQNRGPGGRMLRRDVFIPQDPAAATVESAAAPANRDRLAELREIVEMNILAGQLAPRQADPIKMLETVVAIVRGTQPADPLSAFLQGAKWSDAGGAAEDPTAALTAAGVKLLERHVTGSNDDDGDGVNTPAMLKKLVAAFDQRMSRSEKVLQDLARRLNGNEAAPVLAESETGETAMSVSLLEIFQALLVGAYESGEHVAIVLRTMDKAGGGALRRELETYALDDLLLHMNEGLKSAGHGERYDAFADGVRLFLKPKG